MPTLHFTCGKIASGKTSLARRIAELDGAILISEDVWLARMYPDTSFSFHDYLRRSRRLRSALTPHLIQLLRRRLSVVLDFAGNVPAEPAWVRSIFEAAGADHRLHYLKVSDAVCKARLRERNAQLPDGAQVTSDEAFDTITAWFIPPAGSEGFQIVEHESAS